MRKETQSHRQKYLQFFVDDPNLQLDLCGKRKKRSCREKLRIESQEMIKKERIIIIITSNFREKCSIFVPNLRHS